MSEELYIKNKENEPDRTPRVDSRNRKDGKLRVIVVKFTRYVV